MPNIQNRKVSGWGRERGEGEDEPKRPKECVFVQDCNLARMSLS